MSKLSLVVLICTLLACKEEVVKDDTIYAMVQINAIHQSTDTTYLVGAQPHGQIHITQHDSIVTFDIQLENFPPNSTHAVHIHTGSCQEPGMHWNQGKPMTTSFCNERSLGIPWSKPMAGDVGNVSVGYDGLGTLLIKTDLWRLNSQDHRDIIGRAVMIHDTLDDFTGECDPGHMHGHTHPNPKVACGSIELVSTL